ncbi:MAG: phage tail protein [Saprospiraceae bacterium]|nr:phage tail protein [Saprospiraceae bacterium]
MPDKITFPKLSFTDYPPVVFHFQVHFLTGGVVPNEVDIRFQKLSGLSADISPETYEEGGQNLYTHRFPNRISYGNLVLERGMVIGSILGLEFNTAMSMFRFYPSNVMVMLLNADSEPVANWMFFKAYPVKWAISDLDANSNQIAIESMELAYTRFQRLTL